MSIFIQLALAFNDISSEEAVELIRKLASLQNTSPSEKATLHALELRFGNPDGTVTLASCLHAYYQEQVRYEAEELRLKLELYKRLDSKRQPLRLVQR